MKKIILFIAAALMAAGIYTGASAQKKMEKVTFSATLKCDKCRMKIEDSIPFEKGVKLVLVDVAGQRVTITYDSSKTNPATLKKALEELDYTVQILSPEEAAATPTLTRDK